MQDNFRGYKWAMIVGTGFCLSIAYTTILKGWLTLQKRSLEEDAGEQDKNNLEEDAGEQDKNNLEEDAGEQDKNNLEEDAGEQDKNNDLKTPNNAASEIGKELRSAGQKFYQANTGFAKNKQNNPDPNASSPNSHYKLPPSSINETFSQGTPKRPSVSDLAIGIA